MKFLYKIRRWWNADERANKARRKVDVYIKDQYDQYIIKKYSLYDTFIVLSYDVIFEIAMAYLFFYRILI